MQDVATVGRPPTMRLPRWPVATVLTVALIAGILFIAFFAAKYFTLNQQTFGLYWPKRGWLLLHIAGGIVALLTGPGQWFARVGTTGMLALAGSGILFGAGIVVAWTRHRWDNVREEPTLDAVQDSAPDH